MRGNINWQVQQIYNNSGIKMIGRSKHEAKEGARKSLNSDNQGATWHTMGKQLGIYSYSTADAYRAVWRYLGNFVKGHYKIKDMEQIEGQHVQAFLESKIAGDVAYKTFSQYAAALEKLETAMNSFAERAGTGKIYAFEANIRNVRSDAQNFLERFNGTRAYSDPDKLIAHINNATFKVVASMQCESGARVSECSHLTIKNLLGIEKDKITGEEKGILLIEKAKGGITGNKYVSIKTYMELEKIIRSSPEGRFEFNTGSYRQHIRLAAEKSGQDYNGTHGLRWNFARERFMAVQEIGGQSYERALATVSQEMFHQRPDITEHYLK